MCLVRAQSSLSGPRPGRPWPRARWGLLLRDLPSFTLAGYDKGRGLLTQALWFAVMNTVFMAWFCPARLRVALLRAFGAQIGEGC